MPCIWWFIKIDSIYILTFLYRTEKNATGWSKEKLTSLLKDFKMVFPEGGYLSQDIWIIYILLFTSQKSKAILVNMMVFRLWFKVNLVSLKRKYFFLMSCIHWLNLQVQVLEWGHAMVSEYNGWATMNHLWFEKHGKLKITALHVYNLKTKCLLLV